jgi:hypothetical protein
LLLLPLLGLPMSPSSAEDMVEGEDGPDQLACPVVLLLARGDEVRVVGD